MNKIRTILSPYFEWFEEKFGQLAQEVTKNNVSPDYLAEDYLSNDKRKQKLITDTIPLIDDFVIGFWRNHGENIDKEIRKLPGLKALFGGDIGPGYSDTIFSNTGVYFDTIIVKDPMSMVITRSPQLTKKRELYYLTYAITQVLHKDIFLADVYPPIAVMTFEKELLQKKPDSSRLNEIAQIDSVAVTNKLYDVKLNTFEECHLFYSRFKNISEVIREIQKPDMIMFDDSVEKSPDAQFEALIKVHNEFYNTNILSDYYQKQGLLHFALVARMIFANELLQNSTVFNAHPFVSSNVSFHWLKNKLKINQELLSGEIEGLDIDTLGLTNSLLSKDLKWLGNIGLDDMVDIRKRGELKKLRSIIRSEISTISTTGLDNFEAVSAQVDQNLSLALSKHQEKIGEIDSEFRTKLAISSSSLLLSIAAAFLPSIQLYAGFVGATSLNKIIQSSIDYYKAKKTIRKDPVAILWRAKNKPDK